MCGSCANECALRDMCDPVFRFCAAKGLLFVSVYVCVSKRCCCCTPTPEYTSALYAYACARSSLSLRALFSDTTTYIPFPGTQSLARLSPYIYLYIYIAHLLIDHHLPFFFGTCTSAPAQPPVAAALLLYYTIRIIMH